MKKTLVILLAIILLLSMSGVGCSENTSTTEQATTTESSPESTDETTTSEDTDETTSGTDEEPVSTQYQQSPMLDDRGLPPVEERMPLEPKLTNELPPDLLDYEIGTYGGVLRTCTNNIESNPNLFVMNNEPLINTPGILGEEISPNIVKDFEVSDDLQEFTFYLREGLRWSDGELVTIEDFRFTAEDVLGNEILTSGFPAWLRSGGKPDGEPYTFSIVDDNAFKMTFDEPYGGFLVRLAIQGWRGYTELLKPAHFLKDYHIDYADSDEIEAKIADAGFEAGEWWNLFTSVDSSNWESNSSKAVGFPVLYPWIYVEKTETIGYFERNPYYFKVDAAGNQLPYIDRIENTLVENIEMVTMKIISGEIDFAYGMFTSMPNIPLYKENEERAGYNVYMTQFHTTPTDIHLNLTHEDPVWREVVQDIRFRKALNYAIDRDEIIEAIYYGFAEPSTILDSTYDIDEANRLLDEMGMTIGSDGYRRAPDGSQFEIPFEIGGQTVDIGPVTELVTEMWRELSLDVSMKTIDATLWGTRNAANELRATTMFTHTPLWYQGDWGQQFWGPLWNAYYNSSGAQGEEPPAEVMEIYEKISSVSVVLPEDGIKAIEEVKESIGDNYWYFIHVEKVRQPFIASKKLANISDKGFSIATGFSGEQFFYKE